MGLSRLSPNRRQSAPPVSDQALRDRFGAHFPQLFAYTRCFVDDDATAGEVVVEAFCRAFERSPDAPDGEFRLALFGLAGRLCRSGAAKRRAHDSLTPRERQVLSLLFDAQLSRGEIGRLLKVREGAVTGALVRGLRKLSAAAPAAFASLPLP